jgi:hypothetical protein
VSRVMRACVGGVAALEVSDGAIVISIVRGSYFSYFHGAELTDAEENFVCPHRVLPK